MYNNSQKHFLIVGGAGFIGSNIVHRLLKMQNHVTVIDNLKSGKIVFISDHLKNKSFNFLNTNIINWRKFKSQLLNIDIIIHLASNADISLASEDPTIDFINGTVLTQEVAELARILKIPKIIYASGSGVYGDHGKNLLVEGITELVPNSPYGASKLSGESILCSYSQMFQVSCFCFRFANVVGLNQTHGVGLDFLKKLKLNQNKLDILGDGNQSKSYIHVNEIIDAILFTDSIVSSKFFVANLTTIDRISVIEIAKLAIKCAGLRPEKVQINNTDSNKGWPGDVPIVNLSGERMQNLGWKPKMNSYEAIELSLVELWKQME